MLLQVALFLHNGLEGTRTTILDDAALALLAGETNKVFGFDSGKVVAIDLFDAVNNKKTLDPELVRLSRVLA